MKKLALWTLLDHAMFFGVLFICFVCAAGLIGAVGAGRLMLAFWWFVLGWFFTRRLEIGARIVFNDWTLWRLHLSRDRSDR
jgi:hypothetical protein